MTEPLRHNYLKKQLRLIAEGNIRHEPGTVQQVDVMHDESARRHESLQLRSADRCPQGRRQARGVLREAA